MFGANPRGCARGMVVDEIDTCIRSKNHPKRKILKELIDWYIVIELDRAKCTVQWAEEHIRKDVCRLNSKLASTTNTQIESS